MECLAAFEQDMHGLIRGVQFTKHRNDFQRQLSKDAREIRNSNNVLVSADKTSNMYLMSRDSYDKLLRDNITKTYKTCSKNAKHVIDHEASVIANKLGIAKRVEVCAEKKAYYTLKDHKLNYIHLTKYDTE